MSNIRNFCIISHIDHGKSTLADRLLELTATVEKREMKEQILDSMDLERERGITIKLQPVRMLWHPPRINADQDADKRGLLFEELTYKIRGAIFNVYNTIGPGHKESVYANALSEELRLQKLMFAREKSIDIFYGNKKVGIYRPDLVIEDSVLVELKALPYLGSGVERQTWNYLKGSNYRLALIVNFSNKLDIKRVVYDQARISANPRDHQRESAYMLNLIDTPGHVDFSYEVSRSLAAVEGAVLLVDATQGVQAQTLANLELAKKYNLTIIPVVNKIDLSEARPEEVALEISEMLDINPDEVIFISAKTGENVDKLLEAVVKRVPPPVPTREPYARALIFDSFYDDYRGVVAYVRVFDGEISKGDKVYLYQQSRQTVASDVGFIQLSLKSQDKISAGEIGYVVTTLKEVAEARVGDTITTLNQKSKIKNQKFDTNTPEAENIVPLPGYEKPNSMVFAEIYTTSGEDFGKLRDALERLKLSDASVTFEPTSSHAFGFGFKCGFLGILHLEIVKERLEREYDLELIVTTPTVEYKKNDAGNYLEPWAKVEVVSPNEYLGKILELMESRRGLQKNIRHLETKVIVEYELPLSEVIVDFYDRVKSATSGYGSVNYNLIGHREGDLVELDFHIAGDKIEAFSRMVYRGFAERIARNMTAKMKEVIPKQNFEVKIQAAVGTRIIASERIAPFRKDVTEKLYGGDVTRKKKLLEKQKKGKRKLAQIGKVSVPTDVFIKLLKY